MKACDLRWSSQSDSVCWKPPDALAREALEDRRGRKIRAVEAGRPGSHRVEDDEDHVGAPGRAGMRWLGSGQEEATRQGHGGGRTRGARMAEDREGCADRREREGNCQRLVLPREDEKEQRGSHP